MERKLVLERLDATINMLRKIPEKSFAYDDFVKESKGDCGTVCCVAGWYPKYFPESGFTWKKEPHSGEVELHYKNGPLDEGLIVYHGLRLAVTDALFYGFKFSEGNFTIEETGNNRDVTKRQALSRFKIIRQAVADGLIRIRE